jgi:Amt family ammonium transporter
MGFADFAGVNAVHMVGGIAGLVATCVIGARYERFDKTKKKEFKPCSIPFVVLGTIILWFCWYGFNCGTVTGISENSPLVGLVAMNTTLGAVGGALSCLLLNFVLQGRIDYN